MNVALPDEGGAPVDRDGDSRPIGVFDSGVGGLSVVRHLQQRLPQENLLYFADQAHIPYGGRTVDEITAFSTAITRFLIDRQAKAIVVACNTATAAAIDALRVGFPDMPFVGMEPALKPAAAQTQTGKIGVLATPGTFASRRYAMLVDRFAKQVEVFEDPCVGLVSRIEAGRLADGETARILDQAVTPMLSAGVDTLVLGCTHYPFVLPLLRSLAGTEVAIIDPAPAVARQTESVLQQRGITAPSWQQGSLTCFSSGDAPALTESAHQLLEQECAATHVDWVAGNLAMDTATSFRQT